MAMRRGTNANGFLYLLKEEEKTSITFETKGESSHSTADGLIDLKGVPSLDPNPLNPLFGLSLGWDFTAEHESGLDDLRLSLGIENPSGTYESLLIREYEFIDYQVFRQIPLTGTYGPDKTPHHSRWTDVAVLTVDYRVNDQIPHTEGLEGMGGFRVLHSLLCSDLHSRLRNQHGSERQLHQKVHTAWDESGFQILVGKDHIAKLRIFYQAMITGNCALCNLRLPGSRRNPPCLVLFNQIPELWIKKNREQIEDKETAERLVQENGILKMLVNSPLKTTVFIPEMKMVDGEKVLRIFVSTKAESLPKSQVPRQGWYSLVEIKRWFESNENP